MKVKELKKLLNLFDDESTVVIKAKNRIKKGTLQVTTGNVGINGVHSGIDWDSGIVFIIPSKPLKETLETTYFTPSTKSINNLDKE